MEHTLSARLWRLVPPPGWAFRLGLLLLATAALAVLGRGVARFGLIPAFALLIWIGLDVLFSASLLHVYQGVARTHQALLHALPFPRGPRVEWREGAGPTPTAWCVVGPIVDGVGGRVARTRMILQSRPSLGASIEITAGGAPSGGGSPLTVPPGAPALRAVVPWGYEPMQAGELLDAYTAGRVRELAALAGPAGLRVLVLLDRVIVDVGRVLRRESHLETLIATTLAVRDRARALATGGTVAFGTAAAAVVTAAPEDAPPTCPVCAAPFAGTRIVHCDACGTPHHADCFEWTGRCGVFQCSGTPAAAAARATTS